MKGVLPLLFFSVTIQLANGGEVTVSSWKPDLEKLMEDMEEGHKGPVTAVGMAIMETLFIIVNGIKPPESSKVYGYMVNSDDSPILYLVPNLSGGYSFSCPGPDPGKGVGICADKNAAKEKPEMKGERCLMTSIIHLLNFLLSNVKELSVKSANASGPKTTQLLLHELISSLHAISKKDVETFDKEVLDVVNVLYDILKAMRTDLVGLFDKLPDMPAVVKFFAEAELVIRDYIDDRQEHESKGSKIPSVQTLENIMNEVLEELDGNKIDLKDSGVHVSYLRNLLKEVVNLYRLLKHGNLKLKKEYGNVSALRQILVTLKSILKRIMDERSNKKDASNSDMVILELVTWIHARIRA